MEIRQLKYFLKVAETLNFSEASRRLFITQSTLSQQISHLEAEIELPLFERSGRGVFLTEAGKELIPYALKAVSATESCMDHINDLKKMLTGELNIGVTYSFRTIMMDTMIDFLKAYPGVKLNIIYRSMEELMLMLKSRQLDFVLAFSPLKFDSEIDSRVIFSNRVAAVVKDGHPLSQQQSARLEDLERYDLVLPARGLQARNAFDKLIDRKDLHLRVKVEVNNVDIIFKLLHRSNYVAVLSESTVLHEDGCVSIPIDVPDNRMEGCIHVLKDAYIKNSAQEFIRMLCQSTSILMNFALKDIL
ncbi:LysR family transcriptional regulator [Segatella bryantii]|uniref:LysR family transcriptional regulator n=1 Tax=Segatella bryantii TaxID=77095 RepID=UPI00242AE8CC|nr:LysR substrate-binding domain-containing protein [Segatella bryantii]